VETVEADAVFLAPFMYMCGIYSFFFHVFLLFVSTISTITVVNKDIHYMVIRLYGVTTYNKSQTNNGQLISHVNELQWDNTYCVGKALPTFSAIR